ncbi:hypothetical protein BCON_0124g00120 [Botryotinia convoluta]|uniref:Uncharacterized protein n=1 Tax=Botryotinia convoluta TaxID=54673 RepID=A0A4Z1HXG7_9HELO|nr:hypothetical protein BCON_0124g00120 [Botryotinia convoluta]
MSAYENSQVCIAAAAAKRIIADNADLNDVNITALKTDIAAGCVSGPNGRGTWDLLYSCLCTLLACVYTAIHLNIPPKGEGKIAGYGRKAKWILIALFAPEIVAYTAFEQSYLCYRFLKKVLIQEKINAENKSQDPRKSDLKMSYAHYAMMGGFAADVSHLHNVIKRATFTTEGIIFLSSIGRTPHVKKEEIDDKSKQDSVGKAVVCLQGIWSIGQAIERKITGYPTTMLEVHTVVHVVCALALYTMWGNKPLDVGVPTMLDFRDEDEKYLAYMLMLGSERGDRSLGLHPPKKWITDLVPDSHNGFKIFNDTPDTKIEYDEPTFVMFQDTQAPPERLLVHQDMASSSTSTPVMVGPDSEVGTTGLIKTIMHVDRSEEPLNDRSEACIAEEKPLVLNSAAAYLKEMQTPLKNPPPIESTGKTTVLFNEQVERISLPIYRYTKAGIKPLLTLRAQNFTGTVFKAIPEDATYLSAAMAIVPMVYGCAHLGALSIIFPSVTERLLWKISCYYLIAVATGFGIWSLVKYGDAQIAHALGWEETPLDKWDIFKTYYGDRCKGIVRFLINGTFFCSQLVRLMLLYLGLSAYIGARMYLVIESFISLRHVPIGVYQTPNVNIMGNVPHI